MLLALTGAHACSDHGEHCEDWANEGECDKNTAYMQHFCKYSCGVCRKISPEELLKDVDENEDGKISLLELIEQLKKARHFHLWEAENKTMSEQELDAYLDPEGPHGTEILDTFAKLDTNQDGKLDRNETKEELDLSHELEEMEEDAHGMAKEEWQLEMLQMQEYNALRLQLSDSDRDGLLNKKEYVFFRMAVDAQPEMGRMNQRHQINLLKLEAKRHMLDFDLNGNGEVDGEELEMAYEALANLTHPNGAETKDEL